MFFQNNYRGNITNWDTSSVTNMSGMFYRAYYFNQNIGNWDTSSVETLERMFYSASEFNQDLRNWNLDSVESMESMFFGSSWSHNAHACGRARTFVGMFACAIIS